MQVRPVFLLLFAISGYLGFGQNPRIDSLVREIGKAEGRDYYHLTNELSRSYFDYDNAKALEWAEKNITSDEIEKFPEQLARVHLYKGLALTMNGDYDTSLELFNKGIEISKSAGARSLWGELETGKGNIYIRQGKYRDAGEAFTEADQILKDDRVG